MRSTEWCHFQLQNTQRAQTSAKAEISLGDSFSWEKTYTWSVFFMSCNFVSCNFDGPSFSCPSFSVNPPRSSRITPLDRTHVTRLPISVITEAVSLSVFALRSILCQKGLAGRLGPLHNAEGLPASP